MLNDLLKLANHYFTWRRRTRPVSMTGSASPRRNSTTATAPGSILGRCATPATPRLRRPRPSQWSFTTGVLLRYIAMMGSPVSRAPREELGEDSDNEGTESEAEGSESERPMPMAKAAPKAAPKGKAKAAPKPLSGWCALQAAIKQGDPCPGPPGTPCCGTWPARLPFTSSPTSRPTRTCGPLSWAGSQQPQAG